MQPFKSTRFGRRLAAGAATLALTAMILAATALAQSPAGPAPQGLRPPSSGDAFQIDATLDRSPAIYRQGEHVTLTVSVNRAAFVSVFNVTADGQAVIIFPHRFAESGFLLAGERLDIPGPNATLKVSPPYGKELLKVVATSEPLPLPGRADFRQLGFRQVGAGAERPEVDNDRPLIEGVPDLRADAHRREELLLGAATLDLTTIGIEEPAHAPRVELVTEKPFYRAGEALTMTVQTTRPCYLSIYSIAEDHSTRRLFPEGDDPRRLIAAYEPFRLSAADATRVSGPIGFQRIVASCSINPFRLPPSDVLADEETTSSAAVARATAVIVVTP